MEKLDPVATEKKEFEFRYKSILRAYFGIFGILKYFLAVKN